MEYSQFLFNKLLDLYYPHKELEYDLMFEDYEYLYIQFILSRFNVDSIDEYQCIINFLKNKYENRT